MRAGQTVNLEAALKPLPKIKESIDVYSDPLLDGQARSLNQQKTAPNIVNIVSADQIGRFPDPNAAEAVQRIPGIVIQRDQREGRFVSVRGTEPRLNSVLINGERIPAPEGHLVTDVEGLTIAYERDGKGYLIASSQGSNSFVIYRREGDNAYVKTFRIVAGNGIDEVTETDGMHVTLANLGPMFPNGGFIAQDGLDDRGSQNFKLAPWQLIVSEQ